MTQVVVVLGVAVIAMALLAVMSLRANRLFKAEPRLPMQWWLDGAVTWTAPRLVALAFMPGVAAVCLAAIVALTAFGRTRPGQEHLVIPVTIGVALALLGIHALHLWLMQRTLRRQG